MKKYVLFILALCLTGCYSSQTGPDTIATLNIIDRNGVSQTINEKERLANFQKTDFLAPQPYQKVHRIYGRDKAGNSRSCITSYHPNGQIKQSLDAENNRAAGFYREWYPNGQLKIESRVLGGVADLNTQAEESWLFEGLNRAWDEEGNVLAEIAYSKGVLQGQSRYYHANGKLWKAVTFEKNLPEGEEKLFLPSGDLFQTTQYVHGKKEGASVRFWEKGVLAFEESYTDNLLMEGKYYDPQGKILTQIVQGKGFRPVLGQNSVEAVQEYRGGVQEGEVKIFGPGNRVLCTYCIAKGEKEGEELCYFSHGVQPKLSMQWKGGVLQGVVKTWYENGILESHKEMSQNKRNGLSTAWYHDGSLMLVEEYDNDRLIKGEYYRASETLPVSKIEKGRGIATLFDADGKFARKVQYHEGRPIE